MTIRLIILLLKGSLIQLSQTEGAHEVFRVELPEHGCDATPSDGLVTAGAEGASLAVVVGLAVWLAFVLKE